MCAYNKHLCLWWIEVTYPASRKSEILNPHTINNGDTEFVNLCLPSTDSARWSFTGAELGNTRPVSPTQCHSELDSMENVHFEHHYGVRAWGHLAHYRYMPRGKRSLDFLHISCKMGDLIERLSIWIYFYLARLFTEIVSALTSVHSHIALRLRCMFSASPKSEKTIYEQFFIILPSLILVKTLKGFSSGNRHSWQADMTRCRWGRTEDGHYRSS